MPTFRGERIAMIDALSAPIMGFPSRAPLSTTNATALPAPSIAILLFFADANSAIDKVYRSNWGRIALH